MIPLSGRVPEEIFRTPRDGVDGGGVSGTFLVFWLSVLGFSDTKEYIGEEAASGEPGGGLPTPGRARRWGRAALWGGPPAGPLRLFFDVLEHSVENRAVGFCFVQFREYFLCRISETKNNRKQELALRHLVNRLVPENA